MGISSGFVKRLNQKRPKVVTGAATLEVNRSHHYTGGVANLALPASAQVGDLMTILGMGAGVYTITQAAGQQIRHIAGNTTAGVAGSLTAGTALDVVEFECVVGGPSTIWKTYNVIGTFVVA
ncbi:MAG: hypothetical protein HYX66_08905 [Ignavibacteria bacterium]|nr:hypothetical protein [Ignavibacteria bacterium]